MDLYEQILIELAEIGDIETSIAILKSSSTIDFLKKQYPARIQQLQRALTRYPFETTEVRLKLEIKLLTVLRDT